MKKIFLIRCYEYSKIGCYLSILFIIFYTVASFKKMDMVIFPYNDMFSHTAPFNDRIQTNALYVNGKRVDITSRLYWKKDFMETSLRNYAAYQQNGQKVPLENYLNKKNYPEWFNQKVVADPLKVAHWPRWYLHYAGLGQEFDSLIIYSFTMAKTINGLRVIDSELIYKERKISGVTRFKK